MNLFTKNAVSFNLQGVTKSEILEELVDLLANAGVLSNRNSFLKSVCERENEFSTGIGMGVAIPHGKSSSVKTAAIAFGRSQKGIDFDSLDGEPAYLFFLLAIPEDSETIHLKTLSEISRKLMYADIREKIKTVKSYEELVPIFN